MALINFQERFANDVESGKKRQTIRKQRKNPFKLGEFLYLYTGLRTRKARRLKITECKLIEGIKIDYDRIIFGNNERTIMAITKTHIRTLNWYAREDGFKDFVEMRDWFDKTHGLPFEGILIKW